MHVTEDYRRTDKEWLTEYGLRSSRAFVYTAASTTTEPEGTDPMRAPLPVLIPAAPFRTPTIAPSLSVVLVNYRQWESTSRLIDQLSDASSFQAGQSEVVLVDNHSPPHRLLSRLRRREGVSLRRWQRNFGFARAVNEGVRLSQGEWLLLLNPDMSVPPGFLDDVLALTQRLDDEPRTGIVGLSLRDSDGRPQPSTGPFPTFLGTLARLVLPRRWRKYNLIRSGNEVDWVTGCCLLVRRQVLREVGGLDASFFLYYEDVDLCRRARQRGWIVRQEPGLFAFHHDPLHARAVSPHLRLLTRHSLLTYAAKHWAGWQSRWLARIVRLEAWVRQLLAGRRKDEIAGRWMERLGELALAMQHGRFSVARRILDRAVREWEESHAPRSVDRHPEPQPARPAPRMPDQRHPIRSAEHAGAGC
jgi:GT2 family glycosyltransferase